MELKGIFLKEIRNHSQSLKLQQIQKICHNVIYSHSDILQHRLLINITGRLAHAVRNSELFRIWSKMF